jgi:hypothetical protein
MTDQILTQEQLRALFEYNPDTGEFISKVRRGRFDALRPVGTINQSGYRHIHINHKKILAHRLVWLYMYGSFPPNSLDHINGVRDDNRRCNLRLATVQENGQNRDKQANNTSGYKGVTWSKKSQKWQAQICHNNRRIQIGVFNDPKEAHVAYLEKSKELHTHIDRVMGMSVE